MVARRLKYAITVKQEMNFNFQINLIASRNIRTCIVCLHLKKDTTVYYSFSVTDSTTNSQTYCTKVSTDKIYLHADLFVVQIISESI